MPGPARAAPQWHRWSDLDTNEAPTLQPKEHDDAAARAIAWLSERHSKAFGTAIKTLLEDLLDEEDLSHFGQADEETWSSIQINLTEWLLADCLLPLETTFH